MINDKIFFDEKDPTGISYDTPFVVFGSFNGRLWSKTPEGTVKFYVQDDAKGKVLQVVTATYSTEIHSTAQTYVDTGLSCIITPRESTSKILVLVSQPMLVSISFSGGWAGTRLLRDSTEIVKQGGSDNINIGVNISATSDFQIVASIISFNKLDAPTIPATPVPITYKTQGYSLTSLTTAIYQRAGGDSVMTLIEIEPNT